MTDKHDDASDEDDKVGYKKPPKAHRFAPGKSGNPNGRPKGSKNFETIFNEVVDSKVTVKKNGRNLSIPVREALLLVLTDAALKHNMQALFKVIDLLRAYDVDVVNEIAAELSEDDAMILKLYTAKVRDASAPEDGQHA
jgi:Family of unknown function (DUF5681)